MKIELDDFKCSNDEGIPAVTFWYVVDQGEITVRLSYEKCYPVEGGYPASWYGINEWSLSMHIGADFNVEALPAAKQVQVLAAVTLFHEERRHAEHVVLGVPPSELR